MQFLQNLLGPIALLAALLSASSAIAGSADEDANPYIYQTRFQNVTWDDSKWQLTTTYMDQGHYQSRMSLSNGYLGINVAAAGPFFEVESPVDNDVISGWPLFNRRQTFATIAGFYDSQPTTNGTNFEWLNQYGGESVISGIPHWAGLLVQADGHVLDASIDSSQISNFASTLDIKSGLMTWSYLWSISSNASVEVKYSMFVHKLYINQAAVQVQLTSSNDLNVTVIDLLEGDCAVRTDFSEKAFESSISAIWSAVRPVGISNVTAYVYSVFVPDDVSDKSSYAQVNDESYSGKNESTIAQAINAQLRGGQTAVFTKYIGAASTDAFPDPQVVAQASAVQGAKTGWDKMLESHVQEWAAVMPKDSVDSYATYSNGTISKSQTDLVELQITAITNPFHILQNTIGANALLAAENNTNIDTHSIAVCGLGSDCYGGLVFWDAEVWMAPGLVVSHPQAMKQISNYRVKLFNQAKSNVKEAFTSSKNETGRFTDGGAVFPWTSGRFGNCTGTGPCFDYEYHINGDIGLQLYNYYVATGDTDFFQQELFPIYDAVAHFYGQLVDYNASSSSWDLHNATDPDEYANHVDNAGYTMALMQTHFQTTNSLLERFGLPSNDTWTAIAQNITVPVNTDAHIILEYQGMNGSISVKQADVVLVDDFLPYENPYSLSDLDYYAGKQTLNGPGMTYGVFSIVANEISPSGCSSYTYDLYGSQPYTRGPWFQFSEQLIDDYTTNGGTHPAYPFLTGIGGANRVAVFGYLGLRLTLKHLNIDPNLPPYIPQIRYRTIYWQGHPVSAFSNTTHTTLSRLPNSLPNCNSAFATQPIPVTVGLSDQVMLLGFNSALVVPNRGISFNATQDGNIAQCRPVQSDADFFPGQFPVGAVDGAISTQWQPLYGNRTSASVTVELSDKAVGIPVVGFKFNWAQNPPLLFQVYFSNTSDINKDGVLVFNTTKQVEISNAYDATKVADIATYVGNTTNVTLPQSIAAAKYASLVISGTQGDITNPGDGATVADWAILREGGGRVVPSS